MTTYPFVRIDFQHRMLAVRLSDRDVSWTDQLDDAHLVDIDSEGQVVGLDIMTLDDFKLDEMATRFSFQDQLPAIRAAIERVMSPATISSAGQPVIVQGTRVANLSATADTADPEAPLVPPIVR